MKHRTSRKAAVLPQSRWLAYATAGLATAAATAPAAEAEIHYFSPVRIHIDGNGGGSWRVPLTGVARLSFYRFNASAPARTLHSDVIQIRSKATVHAIRGEGYFSYASNLPPGSNVSGGQFFSVFLYLIRHDRGQFRLPGIGYAGFKFDVGNGAQYGWVRLRTDANGPIKARMTVLDYAFADPGEPIAAGQRTENEDVMRPPAEESLGALALGAVGLTAWRAARRKDMARK